STLWQREATVRILRYRIGRAHEFNSRAGLYPTLRVSKKWLFLFLVTLWRLVESDTSQPDY
ncbi:MAG: hypothetical protein AAF483_15760, partial [Planctomycetota bacterium]